MIYFTSDIHFGHKNVIQYGNRPYSNVEEMHHKIMQNWNDTISDSDEVYYLGDLSFLNPEKTCQILENLRGKKYWIAGNHDKKLKKNQDVLSYFEWCKDIYNLKVHDIDAPGSTQRIVLCHYAMRVWDCSHHGAWHLYGHSHGSLPDNPNSLSWDVGVDNNSWYPRSYLGIKEIMKKKTFKPVDAHGKERNNE